MNHILDKYVYGLGSSPWVIIKMMQDPNKANYGPCVDPMLSSQACIYRLVNTSVFLSPLKSLVSSNSIC